MTLHGPTSSEWDEAISPPLIMTDWGHNSAFAAVTVGLEHEDILLNGRGNVRNYNGTPNQTAIRGPYSITFDGPQKGKPIKKYLLRIINTSFDSTFVLALTTTTSQSSAPILFRSHLTRVPRSWSGSDSATMSLWRPTPSPMMTAAACPQMKTTGYAPLSLHADQDSRQGSKDMQGLGFYVTIAPAGQCPPLSPGQIFQQTVQTRNIQNCIRSCNGQSTRSLSMVLMAKISAYGSMANSPNRLLSPYQNGHLDWNKISVPFESTIPIQHSFSWTTRGGGIHY